MLGVTIYDTKFSIDRGSLPHSFKKEGDPYFLVLLDFMWVRTRRLKRDFRP